ncbi:unnamed protein product, partial [Amoebophrya sp. A120]
ANDAIEINNGNGVTGSNSFLYDFEQVTMNNFGSIPDVIDFASQPKAYLSNHCMTIWDKIEDRLAESFLHANRMRGFYHSGRTKTSQQFEPSVASSTTTFVNNQIQIKADRAFY